MIYLVIASLAFGIVQSSVVVTSLDASLQCYACNSSELVKCATNPFNLQRMKCAEDEKFCITKVTAEGHTIRGCSNGKPENETQLFESCDSPLCNDIMFPKDRRRCFECKGAKCFEPDSEYTPQYCPIYKKNDKCYTHVIDESEAERGCFSSFKGSSQYTVTCEKDNCNHLNGHVDYSCIECKSSGDKNCKTLDGTKKECKFQLLLGRNEKTCYTYHKFDYVQRGCHRDSGLLQFEKEHFGSCVGSNCNNAPISVPKCAVCGPGTSDPDCKVNKVENCNADVSSCHSCLIGAAQYQRGCGKSPVAKPNVTQSCYQCQGEDGCNTKPFQKCFKCDSKTNPNCIGPLNVTAIEIEICESSNSKCLSAVNVFGYTERGCSSSKFRPETKIKSQECTGNLCNTAMFPEDRLKCFRCNGTNECNVKQNDEKSQPCLIYSTSDLCFEHIKNKKEVHRGCKSDPEFKDCVKNHEGGCFSCGKTNCNKNFVTLKAPEQTCYKCDSAVDKDCNWSQAGGKNLKPCNENIPFDKAEMCYMHTTKEGDFRRGCAHEDKICMDGNTDNCRVCSGVGCNAELNVPEKCIQMDLESEGGELLERTPCAAKNQTYATRGCFVKRTIPTNSIHFGCISDFSQEEYDECVANPKRCNTCIDGACDNMKIPDPSGRKAKLSCFKCSGEKNNQCKYKQSVESVKCSKFIADDAIVEQCFTRKDADGKIQRGCSNDEGLCTDDSDKFCKTCKENGCNSELLIAEQCIQEKYKPKAKNEKDLKRSECKNSEQFWTNRGCYVKNDGKEVTWGCISDISEDEFNKCKSDDKKCNYCRDDTCDKMKMPNSSNRIGCASLLIMFSLILKNLI